MNRQLTDWASRNRKTADSQRETAEQTEMEGQTNASKRKKYKNLYGVNMYSREK